jgi:3-deoxy-manno-octulosonate cytidylyltransferase (CMP-KDO synthetase)
MRLHRLWLPGSLRPVVHCSDAMTQQKPRVVGLIPARYASTRLPGKMLMPILGKSMIQRVLERVQLARGLHGIWVAVDDDRIRRAVEQCGGKAIMTSPRHPSGTDRLAEAVRQIEADIIVNIQGDQPFLDPLMIEEAVQPLLEEDSLPMATLMHEVSRPEDLVDPSVVKVVVDRSGYALYFSRSLIPYPRQPIRHAVYEHVGLYVYRREFLFQLARLAPTQLEQVESLEQLRVLEHGYRIQVVETRAADHVFTGFSVDTAEDLLRAEALLRERGLS